MFTSINRTVFDIPLTWDRNRFEASRIKCQKARKLIEMSINAQYNKQLKDVFFQKLDIEKDITESQERLFNQEKKVHALDILTIVAEQSLTDYFDKRMENVRLAIQEHCNAIQQILHEENEHWQEIHTAIDQNLITSDDIHPPNKVTEEIPSTNIHTIDEADEEEEHTSKLLNNKTVTPILTQMIRKSRLQSNRNSIIESNRPSTSENLIQSKQERLSVIVPLTSARRTLPVIDTTFVVKLEESNKSYPVEIPPNESLPTTESNKSYPVEIPANESLPATESNKSYPVEIPLNESLPTTGSNKSYQVEIPPNKLYQVEVVPIESVPTVEDDITPSYSEPKPPARLYFSPTLLQDDEELELIQPVLSTIDQNQMNIEKPRIIARQFGQTYLLDNIKAEEINKSQDTENIRPKISDEIPFMITCDPTMLMEKETLYESHHSEILVHQKSIVYAKRRTRVAAAVTTKVESEPIHMTRRATRNQKPTKEIIETKKRQTRKRKQSGSDDTNKRQTQKRKQSVPDDTKKRQTRKRKQSISDDTNNNTVALRKKKIVPTPPAKTNTGKTRVKKPKEVPIREPSPLPIIDRSKHYSTRFSTRSHRLNNRTLSTTTMIDDDNNNNNKSKHSSTGLRTKSMGRIRNHDNDGDDKIFFKTRSKQNKNQSKPRAKSMVVTRNRRK